MAGWTSINNQVNLGLTALNGQKFIPNMAKYRAAADPNTYKDIPTLNAAVRAGIVSKQDGLMRLKQLTGQSKSAGPTQFSILHPSTLIPGVKAYGPSVVNQQDITPVKNTFVGAYQQARNQAKYLSGPTSTQQQRNAIINNQKTAQNNPSLTKTINKSATKSQGVGQGNTAQGLIKATQMAKQGKSPQQIQTFLTKDRQALASQTGRGLNAIATIGSFSVPGQGILAKGLGAAADKTGAVAALGKDEATNALINSQKITSASKASRLADKLGSSSVKEAKTQRIPVINPTETTTARQAVGSTALKNSDRTSIPVSGKSTQVAGKITTSSDTAYIKASNKLSNQYEKDLAKVQKVPHPVTQQTLQRQLDTKYNALQQNLDDTYGKTSISFKGKPTKVPEASTTLPRSALTKNPVTPFNSTRIPISDTRSPTLPKSPTETSTPVTDKNKPISTKQGSGTKSEQTSGSKISGSSLNSEQRAVQKGLVNDLGEKATYTGGSYKQEAANAVKLVNEKPEEARSIAMGEKAGNNTIHEVAVRRAVENKALQNNDINTLTRLASSKQHTATSEAAQRLGSEGFNTNNSPVQAIREIRQARQTALGKGEKATKAVSSTVKDIQKTVEPKMKVSRQDWHSFIKELQCK